MPVHAFKNSSFSMFFKRQKTSSRTTMLLASFCIWQSLFASFINENYEISALLKNFLRILSIYHDIKYLNLLLIFTFFYIHKMKILDSRKFSKSGFRRIYMFWDVLDTIWPFLENVCLSVCRSVCLYYFVDAVSPELMGGNWWNLTFSCIFMGLRAD